MEEQFEASVGAVKAASDPQKKVEAIQALTRLLEPAANQPTIDDGREDMLPYSSLDALILLCPTLLTHHSHLVYTCALTTYVPTLLKCRLLGEKLKLIAQTSGPALVEKLNDAKERIHRPAEDCLITLLEQAFSQHVLAATGSQANPAASAAATAKGKQQEDAAAICERSLRDALTARSARIKLGAMKVSVQVKTQCRGAMSLRPFLPLLVENLEDADGAVREAAKESIVSVLSVPGVPLAARSELRKLCEARSIKTSTIDAILAQLLAVQPGPGAGGSRSVSATASSLGRSSIRPANQSSPARSDFGPATDAGAGRSPTAPAAARGGSQTTRGRSSIDGLASENGGAAEEDAPSAGASDVPKVYISTERELEDEFRAMSACFEGKETEHNWSAREKAIFRVRGILQSEVVKQYPQTFLACLKAGFLANSVKALLSLRTTLAVATTSLYVELATSLRNTMDPLVDVILPHLGRMAGYTKRIVAEASQRSVTAIIQSTSAPPKVFVPFLIAGLGDKIVSARQYFATHLQTYLEQHAQRHKDAITHAPHDGFAQLQAAMRKALTDSNPAVREATRLAYWLYEAEWPSEAEQMMSQLDDPAQKQLRKAKETVPTNQRPTTSKAAVGPVPRKPSSSIAEAIKKAKMEAKQRQREEEEQAQADAAEAKRSKGELRSPETAESQETYAQAMEKLAESVSRAATKSPSDETGRPEWGAAAAKSQQHGEHAPVVDATETVPHEDEQDVPSGTAERADESDADHAASSPAADTQAGHLTTPATTSGPGPAKGQVRKAATSELNVSMAQSSASLTNGAPSTGASTNGSTDTLYDMLQIAPDSSFWRQRYKPGGSEARLDLLSQSDISPQDVVNVLQSVAKPPTELGLSSDNQAVFDSVGRWSISDADRQALLSRLPEIVRRACKDSGQESSAEPNVILLWDIALKCPSVIADEDAAVVDYCLSMRAHPSANLRRASSALLSLIALSSPSPVLFLHVLLRQSDESRRSPAMQGAGQAVLERMDVMTCVTSSMLVLKLPSAIWEDEAGRLRPLVERALSSSSVITREAAITLLMVLLAVFHSSIAELSRRFPALTPAQANLVVYLLGKHQAPDEPVVSQDETDAEEILDDGPSLRERSGRRRLDPEALGRSSRRLSMGV